MIDPRSLSSGRVRVRVCALTLPCQVTSEFGNHAPILLRFKSVRERIVQQTCSTSTSVDTTVCQICLNE